VRLFVNCYPIRPRVIERQGFVEHTALFGPFFMSMNQTVCPFDHDLTRPMLPMSRRGCVTNDSVNIFR